MTYHIIIGNIIIGNIKVGESKNMNLVIARIKAKLTQKELAQKVNMSPVTICRLEKGNVDSTKVGTLKKIAKALNSDVVTLFFSDEE